MKLKLSTSGYAVTNHYNLLGQITNVTDSAGGTNWMAFNNQGLRTLSSNTVSQVESQFFDIEDRVALSTNANGVVASIGYDNLNRIVTRTNGGTETFGYNSRGMTSYVSQLGKTTLLDYDALRRKTAETNANGVTRFSYDGAGDLLTLTDGNTMSRHGIMTGMGA
jgi:YD repeat-containing protein